MNKEIGERWCTALESGEYQRGFGALTRVSPDGTRRHCCLGVLTDLAVKAGVTRELTGPQYAATNGGDQLVQYYSYTNDYGVGISEGSYLPKCVQDWAGLDNGNPLVPLPGDDPGGWVTESMAGLNDNRDYTFAQIAAVVRAQLAGKEEQA
jgi:hypothetical protein